MPNMTSVFKLWIHLETEIVFIKKNYEKRLFSFSYLLSLNCIIANVSRVFPLLETNLSWSVAEILIGSDRVAANRRRVTRFTTSPAGVCGPLGSLQSNRSGSIIVRLDSIKPLQTRRRVAVAADNKFDFGVSQKRNEPRRKTVTSPNHRMWTPRRDVSCA